MTNQTKYPYTLIKFDKGICLMIDDNNTYSNFADLLSSKVSIEDTKKLYDDEGYDTLNDETGDYDPIYTLSVYLTEYKEHHEEWMWLYNNPYLDITYNNYDIFFLEKMPELVKQAFRLVWKDCNSYVVDDCLALAKFINEYNYKLEQTSVQQVQESVNTSTQHYTMSKLLYNIFVPRKTGYCFDETGLSEVEIKQLYDKLWNIPHITIWGNYQNIQYIIGLIKDNNIYYSIGVDDGIYPVFEVVISQQDYNKISNIVTNKYQLIEINDDYVQWYYGLISYLLNDTSPLISYDNNGRNYNQTQVEHYEALIYPLYKKYSYIVDNDKLDDVISYFKKVFAQTDSNYYQSRVKEYSYENLKRNHTEYVDKLRLDNSINYFQTEGYPTTPQIISYEVQAKLCNQSMITWVELDNGNTVSDKIMKKHNITVYPNEQLYIDKQNLIKSLSVKQESVNTSTPQIYQPTEQTSVQEEQQSVASIDQEVMMYLNDYDDTFSYEGHQDYQEVYIPTTEDSPTPQQPVVTTPPKQYDLSKEYMDKFATGGLSIFTNATVHNWQ